MKKNRAFLKWAGGKFPLLDDIKKHLPEGECLIEPFVGAGSVFLNTDFSRYILADINSDLISLYNIVKMRTDEYVQAARELFVPETNCAEVYYQFREEFNKSQDPFRRAVLFLYLNRYGYNGLCRYNLRGEFNVPGNVSAGAEANMAGDPEAADAVLRSGRKLTMVGLDVTHRVVLTRRDVAGWTGSGTMAGCAFASMVEHYIGSYEMNAPYLGGCALHDPLAVAVAIDPTLVGALGCNLRVDLLGEYRGRTICDEHRLSDPDKSALVALTVDAPRFLAEFKARMARILG